MQPLARKAVIMCSLLIGLLPVRALACHPWPGYSPMAFSAETIAYVTVIDVKEHKGSDTLEGRVSLQRLIRGKPFPKSATLAFSVLCEPHGPKLQVGGSYLVYLSGPTPFVELWAKLDDGMRLDPFVAAAFSRTENVAALNARAKEVFNSGGPVPLTDSSSWFEGGGGTTTLNKLLPGNDAAGYSRVGFKVDDKGRFSIAATW